MMQRFVDMCTKHSDRLGKILMVLSVTMAIIGFPAQIWKNYQTQSCGLSIILIIIPLGIFAVRIPYSIGKRTWHLIPADTIGILADLVILGQYFYYG